MSGEVGEEWMTGNPYKLCVSCKAGPNHECTEGAATCLDFMKCPHCGKEGFWFEVWLPRGIDIVNWSVESYTFFIPADVPVLNRQQDFDNTFSFYLCGHCWECVS
jgi:hypothetical protein